MNDPILCILPTLRARRTAEGKLVITQKFLDGLMAYHERWPGQLRVRMELTEAVDSNLDHVEVDPSTLPFDLAAFVPNEPGIRQAISGAAVALVSLVEKHTEVSRYGADMGVRIVYLSEYSLQTRRQIIAAKKPGWLRQWRRNQWTTALERKYVQALSMADGVQCNGLPTYGDYSRLTPDSLLYFDTRVQESQVVSTETLEKRVESMLQGRPLQLFFTGRLIDIKGVDHLPLVAESLRQKEVDFNMHICGDGDLAKSLGKEIASRNLSDCMKLYGVLDFHTRLVPMVSSQADLFVCCHRQGDPSCTYLETMACGTPIAGYDNEAFAGLVRYCGIGWTAPMDEPEILAQVIQMLDRNRDALAGAAVGCREFALRYTFDRTAQQRIDHLTRVAKLMHDMSTEMAA